MNGILLMIREAVTSKKFIMAIAGSICAALLRFGLDIPVEDVAAVLSPIAIYIAAQGWADRGKGAAKVEALAEVAKESNASASTQVKVIKEA